MSNYDLTDLPMFLTIEEFANILRIGKTTVRDMINRGAIPADRIQTGATNRQMTIIHRNAINHVLKPANPLTTL